MKIVIAPDSFKESLSAPAVAQAIADGVRRAIPEADVALYPMADGGEGTVDAVLAGAGGQRLVTTVCGSLGEPQSAHWGLLDDGRAVIEMASAAGLEQVPLARRDPLRATSHGVGELIVAALDAGATRIILGLGGSATNDGGAGMLTALGVQLFDAQNKPLAPGGAALADLARLDVSGLDARLAHVTVELASDVDNPLCGPHGASAIFGPQKGATPEQVAQLDAALAHFAALCADTLASGETPAHERPGAGAAGGLGFAAMAFLGARFRPGVELVADLAGLAEGMRGATLAITGEGRFDAQTLRGKTPAGVAAIAGAAGVPVIVLAGALGESYQDGYARGVTAAFSAAPGPITLETACAEAARLLADRACDVTRVFVAGMAAARRPAP